MTNPDNAPNIGDITATHHKIILANNLQYVHWLAPLDQAELDQLLSDACYTKQIDDGQCVLIGMSSDGPYQSACMRWMQEKFDRFMYIDRISIGETAQRKGYGRALYDDFARFALGNGYPRLVCEVNTVPDNPGSHKFHTDMGFTACGSFDLPAADGTIKSLRAYEKKIFTNLA